MTGRTQKQLKKIVLGMVLACFGVFVSSVVLATTLNSTNFQVQDFNLNLGGDEQSTSTNYVLQPNLELVLTALKTLPSAPPTTTPPPPGPGSDTTPPVISNVQVINITETSATVIWTTNESSDSGVDYGLTTSYGSASSSATMVISHSIDLTGLGPNTLYHFRVKSKDAVGNEAISGDYTFTTLDNVAPIISNVQVINITETSATVIWTTNESSDSGVDYGLATSYGSVSSSATMVISHSIDLTGLGPNTLYHFRVKSKDAVGNEAISGDYTFSTLDLTAPVISNVRVENITGVSAVIKWDTNEPATSRVDYGLTESYGNSLSDTELVTSHAITVTGLTPQTTYNFMVTSADSKNNSASSGNFTFMTLDTIPPVISNIQVINITDRSADVTWTTNEATASRIYYRRTGEAEWLIFTDNALQVSHFNTLTSLIANVDYEFYIVAQDSAGNEATSDIGTFRTLRDFIPPSNIRNFIATPDDSLNVLTWQNPPDADYAGVMIVRSTENYPRNRFEGEIIYVGKGTSFNDIGLTNGTKYYYTGFAFDTSFNYASGAITDGTPFKAGEEPVPPPEEPEPPTPVPGANLDIASFWVAKRTIEIFPDEEGNLETLAGIELGVTLDVAKLPEGVDIATLRIDASNYLFKIRDDGSAYDADVYLPQEPGSYVGAITLVIGDEQRVIRFRLDLKSHGSVFEIIGGVAEGLQDAQVTLYELRIAGWKVWEAGAYYQTNPVITPASGGYAFLVPNGIYYLEVKKDGYRDRATSRFTVEKNYINSGIEMLRVPQKISEAIIPGATVAENTVAIAKAVGKQAAYQAGVVRQEVVKAVQNIFAAETVNTTIAASTITSIAVVNVVSIVPFLSLFSYLQYLITQPLIFFFRRRRKAWGTVYNAYTKLPLDLAIVRLFDAATRRVIRTVVTDKQGRYLMSAPQGSFTMQAIKPGFIFPSIYLAGKKADESFTDLYFGGTFDVKQESQMLTYNLPMDFSDKKEASVRRMVWGRNFRSFQYGMLLSGLVLEIIAFILSPTVQVGVFLGLHILILAAFIRLAMPWKFKKWGYVRDAVTGKPIKNAIVRLFEPEYNKLLGTQITDGHGRYAFLVGRNVYYVTFEKAGYEGVKTKNIDMRTRAKVGAITEEVKMKPVKSTKTIKQENEKAIKQENKKARKQ